MSATHFFKKNQPASRLIAQGLFWAFIVLALIMQLGWIDVVDHDMEWFLVYMLLFSAVGMVAPFIVAQLIPRLREKLNDQSLGILEILAGLAIVSSWIGAFGLYRDGFGYDTFVHFFASFCLMGMFTIVLMLFPVFRNKIWVLLLLAGGLTLVGGLLNEVFEYMGDLLFETMMYGELGQPDDTLRDLIADGVGIGLGAVIFYFVRDRFGRYIKNS